MEELRQLRKAASNIVFAARNGWLAGFIFIVGCLCLLVLLWINGFARSWLIWQVQPVNFVFILFAIVLLGFGGFVVAFLRGRTLHISHEFLTELDSLGKYEAGICSEANLRIACDWTKPVYGTEYVESAKAEQWRRKNPQGFIEITNLDGELCACFGILPIEPRIMDMFVNGQVRDTRFTPNDILTLKESKNIDRLYISGTAVAPTGPFLGKKYAGMMICAMVRYLKMAYGVETPRTLYALSATPQSAQILPKLGFRISSPAAKREDGHDLYELAYDKKTVTDLRSKIADCSPFCRLEINRRELFSEQDTDRVGAIAAQNKNTSESEQPVYVNEKEIFPPSSIRDIHDHAVSLELHASRAILLGSLPTAFVAGMSKASNEKDQLLLDLQKLNRCPALGENRIAIVEFLEAMSHKVEAHESERKFFQTKADEARTIVLKRLDQLSD